MSRAKTMALVAAGVLGAGLLWSLVEKAKEEAAGDPKAQPNTSEESPGAQSDGPTSANSPGAQSRHPSANTETSCRLSTARTEVRDAGRGRGRGQFATADLAEGETVLSTRPALTLLYEPFCATHCLGCAADLHAVPGRQCHNCGRFAVCRCCDLSFGLYEWHERGECLRWRRLPEPVRAQPKCDPLWLLVRYRAALEEDMDFTDLSTVGHASDAEQVIKTVQAAAEAAGADGGKEAVGRLSELSGNSGGGGPLDAQLEAMARAMAPLCDLEPADVKSLVLRLRTNAGSIHVGGQNVGCALSTNLSFFNHSCDPNVLAEVTGGHLVVTARRALAAGEELTICYVDERWPKHQRQTVLRDHYKFECDCPRCDAETS